MEQEIKSINDSKKLVLIIEDDYFIQDLYQSFLESSGLDVICSSDGKDGFEQAVAKIPNVILLDIMLPTMNGIEVIKLLKITPQTKQIPVILITNLGHQDIINTALKLGAQGYLLKVRCSPEQLVSTVMLFINNPDYKMNLTIS
jgi:two-component system, OmpR family, alkaline phosphatase synthesis response regulator PhoP